MERFFLRSLSVGISQSHHICLNETERTRDISVKFNVAAIYDMGQIKRPFATRQSENTIFSLRHIKTVFHEYYGKRGAYLKF